MISSAIFGTLSVELGCKQITMENATSTNKTTAWHSEVLRQQTRSDNNRGFGNGSDSTNGQRRDGHNREERKPRTRFADYSTSATKMSVPVRKGPTTAGIPAVRDRLRIIPLGGLGEIGKNMTAFEYNDSIVVIDSGTMFPDSYMYGIDYLIPNILYLEEHRSKIKGIIITHGHEDHIGALPFVAKKLEAPIYAPVFAKGLIELKFEEHGIKNITLKSLKAGDVIQFGEIRVEAFHMTHSVPDTVGYRITTPDAKVIWMTDWKLDPTPVDNKPSETDKLAKWAKEGVDVLFSESTNIERPGHTTSEKDIGQSLKEIFAQAQGRVILATFASQIHRVYQVIQAAVATNRKIAFSGMSMVRNAEMAINLGYIDVPKDFIVPLHKAQNIEPSKLLIVSTGSQGEEMSSLFRMAKDSHRQFRIKRGDTVVLSASPIPGNEAAVGDVINDLFRLGAEVVYGKEVDVHVSGHAYRDELSEVIKIVKPKCFVPIHGEYRHLALHAELARELGVENIIIAEDGEILEMDKGKIAKSHWRAPSESILVDGLGIGDVGNIVLRDRQAMATDGIFVCIITIDRETHEIQTSPDIISRGFVYMRAAEDLIHQARKEIRNTFLNENQRHRGDWALIKAAIREHLGDFLFDRTKRNPMVIPVIIEV